MKKEVSIVLSTERKNYRKLAQEWFGLTDEQMIGMDVHHNPPRHQGGRNIPEHLFVYHETLHSAVHEDEFVLWSRRGAEQLHKEKDDLGRSIAGVKAMQKMHQVKDDSGKSINALKGLQKLNSLLHRQKDEFGRSVHATSNSEKMHRKKDEFGRSLAARKGGKTMSSQRWEDPDHPELGKTNAGNLVRMQIRRGLPHGPENRRRVS
jgi:hypothetical protein